jgi:hypothetical protein
MRRSAWLVGVPVAALVTTVFVTPAKAVLPPPQCFGPTYLGSGITAKMCFTEQEGPSGSGDYIGLDRATSYFSFAGTTAHFVACTEYWTFDNMSGQARDTWQNGCRNPANRRKSTNPQGVLGYCSPPVSQVRAYVTYRYLSTPKVLRHSKTLTMQVHC